MEGENISLIKEGRKWLFSKEQDHWTTLSGLFKAAELGIPLSRKGNYFTWTDGEVRLLLRDRFLLGPDLSTVHEVFYENVYEFPIALDLNEYSVIDIGGYIGDSALWFVEQGASEVHVYEPIPVNFEILQKNVELNKELISRKGSKVNIYHEGISDSEKTIEVPYWGGPGTSLDEPLEGKETRKVSTISLEKAFERVSKPIGVVKIDCEGCEFQIFSDSRENRKILGEAKAYIVEVHGNDAKTRRIASILKDMGYAIQDVSKLAKNVFVLKATKN
ncbi:MAG: FkbM family methyltransferase [Chlorobi bacterium]|nr:FkbM family methyltransferase [Chlorobiota bacterium]